MVKTGIHSRRLGSGRQLHRGKNYVKDLKLGIRLSQAGQPEKAPKKGEGFGYRDVRHQPHWPVRHFIHNERYRQIYRDTARTTAAD